jgi:hypothetical protein
LSFGETTFPFAEVAKTVDPKAPTQSELLKARLLIISSSLKNKKIKSQEIKHIQRVFSSRD